MLITTPESFDSLLCRAHTDNGHLLSNVTAVVLDEIHLLYGTPRGEQVRWLLTRLRRLRKYARTQSWARYEHVQVCALSATVDDPDGIRLAYLSNGIAIAVSGGRAIEEVPPAGSTPATDDSLLEYLKHLDTDEKILVFSNTRRRVDQLCHDLRPELTQLGFEVHAHHGSLAREAREKAEHEVKTQRRVVLFATSTLEIGIDIGDIDLVVLDGPAHDVRSLLQRIGRGNRRTAKTRVMPCAGSVAEMVLHSAMLKDARNNHLAVAEKGPQLAVARQQVFSYIFQRKDRVRKRDHLTAFVDEMSIGQDAKLLLDHMVTNGELTDTAYGVRLSQDQLDRAIAGEVHSNIEARPGQIVVDDVSGAEIARGVKFKDGPAMRIGGQLLAVRDVSTAQVAVNIAKDRGLPEGRWNYVSGAWMHSASQPDSLRRFLLIEANVWPMITVTIGVSAVFHFGGDRTRAVLRLLERAIPDLLKVDQWAVYLPTTSRAKPASLEQCSVSELETLIPRQIKQLERSLVRPEANRQLPIEWRLSETRGWLSLEDECARINKARWIDYNSTDTGRILQLFSTISRV